MTAKQISLPEHSQCCGCKACADVCAHNAISFEMDKEGFEYPIINTELCVGCGRCKRVCPVLHKHDEKVSPQRVMAVKNKNDDILMQSSSGGVFSAIAETVIEDGGVVFGVEYDDKIHAVFGKASKIEHLTSMRGSKYVQADAAGVYSRALEAIKTGIPVLFVGTPCQVAAMRALAGEADNLLLMDFICHGVGSPKLFDEFLRYYEGKRNKKIIKYSNRSKVLGWRHTEHLFFSDGSEDYNSLLSQAWRNIFYSHGALRPSCSACKFNHYEKRSSDITIGDFWGIEKKYPDFDSQNGVSLVVLYSEKGKVWFDKAERKTVNVLISVEDTLERQPHFRGVSAQSEHRLAFWELYDKGGIKDLIKIYGKCNLKLEVKQRLKESVLYKWYRSIKR